MEKGVRYSVIYLEPRDEDISIRRVTLWIREGDAMVSSIQVVDINDTVMDFVLDKIDLNPAFGPRAFDLDFPEGAEIIDLRN